MEKTKINIEDINFNKQSWFDSHGRVFYYKNKIFRGIYSGHVDFINELLQTGIIDMLVEHNLFPETKISELYCDEFPLILEHQKIELITYPYEWSFSMLKDAAITILKTNKIANKFAYQLKDCHENNVLFDNQIPKFIDLGSFIKYDSKNGDWEALDEFYRCYIYPLRLWSKGLGYIARNSLTFNYGVLPHSIYFSTYYVVSRIFKPGFLDKVFTFWYAYKKFYSLNIESYKGKIKPKKLALVEYLYHKRLLPVPKTNIESLIRKVKRIDNRQNKSYWGNYHSGNFELENINHRFTRILAHLKELSDVESVLDVAANQGYFSQLILKNTKIKKVISTDYDEVAVDLMYTRFKKQGRKPAALILQNFIIPVSNLNSVSSDKRFKCDVAIALALTHHLFLTQHIPAPYFFELLKKHANKFVMVEFMPLGLYNGSNNPIVPDWYNIIWFRTEFKKYYKVISEEQLEENRVLFVGEVIP